MESNRTGAALSAISLGLIGLCFALLIHEAVITRGLWSEIPRVFCGFLAPVPLAVFVAYSFVDRAGDAPVEPSPNRTVLMLVVSIAFTIAIGLLVGPANRGGEIGTGPAIAESAIFSSSILNFLFFRSPLVAAVLSGVSIGLTYFVIFLT